MAHIRKFTSFKEIKNRFDKYNESVIQIDDKYRVGGIEVSQSLINSYVKKVKEETSKNIRQMFSDIEIAEQLVKYVATYKLDVDKIPAAALLGGEIPMDDDDTIDETTEEETTETGIESEEQPLEDAENTESDVDVDESTDEENELPTDEDEQSEETTDNFEDTNVDEKETEVETEDNSDESNEDLPI